MRSGMTMSEFAVEVQRQKDSKRDFKAPSNRIALAQIPGEDFPQSPDGYRMRYALALPNVGEFPVRKLMHQQVAERTKIPWQYYERMSEQSSPLLPVNVNYWLHAQEETRLIRTIDGQARAYLGDKFRPLDNYDLFAAVAPTIMGAAGMRIESIQITETKFFIKAFSDRITADVKVGDRVQAGVTISNSEVGHGTLAVEPSTFRLICLNGAISPDSSLKRRHVGRGSGEMEGVEEYFTDATRRADDEAFWRKVVDVVRGAFDQVRFQATVEKMKAALDNRIPKGGATLQEIQEVVQQKYGLSDGEGETILRNLIEGADLSQFGLSQAITLAAQSEDLTYNRATELERIGGQVIELAQSEWKELVAA